MIEHLKAKIKLIDEFRQPSLLLATLLESVRAIAADLTRPEDLTMSAIVSKLGAATVPILSTDTTVVVDGKAAIETIGRLLNIELPAVKLVDSMSSRRIGQLRDAILELLAHDQRIALYARCFTLLQQRYVEAQVAASSSRSFEPPSPLFVQRGGASDADVEALKVLLQGQNISLVEIYASLDGYLLRID